VTPRNRSGITRALHPHHTWTPIYPNFGDNRVTDRPFYSEITPYRTGRMSVDGGHTVCWEACGNPDGIPVIFLHGGPGAGCSPIHRRFFDPHLYNVILLDQRGCGRSTPHAEIADNSTDHLIADIEQLRTELGIQAWLAFGGSWGSTLALAYGQAHPDRCLGFVLRGIFLGSAWEIEWFLYGMGHFFPEAWRRFTQHLPEAERGDLLANYHRRLLDPDPGVHLPAARHWNQYETDCVSLVPDERTPPFSDTDHRALPLSRLEAHYFTNGVFRDEGALLDRMERIAHLPCVIIQGRYDMICPPRTAHALVARWPDAKLEMAPTAGHSAMEPGIRSVLISATDEFARTFAN
jgi:proline iminopeptidase